MRRTPRARGAVLLVVLVVGIVAALATLALMESGLSGQLAAVHTDVGNKTRAIGEAGMNHAIQLLVEESYAADDFDRVLDVGLDASCSSMPPSPGANDNVPTTAQGFTRVLYDGESYGMRLYGGGAYLVRFDDDDDDLVATARWRRQTGNNEGANSCYEGPPAIDGSSPSPFSDTGNHTGWEPNPLRDRNFTVWVTVVALAPVAAEADLVRARHRSVLRKLHNVVRTPSVIGLEVRGDLRIFGGGSLGACSPIGAAEIDGLAAHNGWSDGGGCACSRSRADSWSEKWTHCNESPTIDCDAMTTTASGHNVQLPGCANGALRTPGPSVPTVPDVDAEADKLIDFSRSCVFYVDNDGSSGNDNSLWVWDAERTVSGQPCSSYEGSGGGMPRPNAAAGFPASCWTPLLLQMDVVAPPAANDPSTGTCYWPPFASGGGAPIGSEKTSVSKGGGAQQCGWAPDGTTSGAHVIARPDPAQPSTWDGLSQKMNGLGLPLYPVGATLNKPAWATACTIEHPPFAESPTSYSCLSSGSGCVANNASLEDNVALAYVDVGPKFPWFPVRDHDDALAAPAGVYFFPAAISMSGSGYDFAAAAHPLNYGDGKPMASYLLVTLATPASIDLQQPGYFFGSGQNHEGGAEPRYRMPTLIANGDISLRGSATQSIGGSALLRGNLDWNGNGDLFLYGELHGNGNFSVGGSGRFWWLYDVPLQELGNGTPAALPTQVFSMQ